MLIKRKNRETDDKRVAGSSLRRIALIQIRLQVIHVEGLAADELDTGSLSISTQQPLFRLLQAECA